MPPGHGGAPEAASTSAATAALGEALALPEYRAGRLQPRRTEGDYLILSDVNALVLRHGADFSGDVFDYGCGGAPYEASFARCRSYIKADVVPGPRVDRLLDRDGLTQEVDASYDWVFSTQVLEHVPDPAAYLRESHRLLRPGGRLLLSTHGLFPEHGCPFDFQRWTADGLVLAARTAGFEILSAGKLTAGVRGAVQMMHHCVWGLRPPPERKLWGALLSVVRKAYGALGVPVLNLIADQFRGQGCVPPGDPSTVYVGVYVLARRPQPGGSKSS